MKVTTHKDKQSLTSSDERLVFAMQLLGDPTRFKMFRLMLSGRELCVSEIAGQLDISVSAVSQHFRNFEQVGLVGKQRMGQRICYVLREEDPLVSKLIDVTGP